MTPLGLIGGSGLTELETLEMEREERVATPYGTPSAPLLHGTLAGRPVVFLARHGRGHTLPPHRVNYRANLWALHAAGVRRVVAVAAVGGITPPMGSGALVVPDQVIDYTWGREQTLFGEGGDGVTHIDFTHPYCGRVRAALLDAARSVGLSAVDGGVYGATQGPRLESIAEINRMERDGCDLVGMTGMPEASLARELGLCYATLAVVANRAAGRGDGELTMEAILACLEEGMGRVRLLLGALAAAEHDDSPHAH